MIKSYFITDPSIIGANPESLESTLPQIITKYAPDYICLRDKNNNAYTQLAEAFVEVIGSHKALLHGNVDLAISLGVYGVHLTSTQYHEISKAKAAGLFVIASTHSYEEALLASSANAITYSPIFTSPNKGKPKGLADLKEIMGKIKTKLFALGGITSNEQIQQVETTGAYGFASIRYFKL